MNLTFWYRQPRADHCIFFISQDWLFLIALFHASFGSLSVLWLTLLMCEQQNETYRATLRNNLKKKKSLFQWAWLSCKQTDKTVSEMKEGKKPKNKDITLLMKEVQHDTVKRRRHQICSRTVYYKLLFYSQWMDISVLDTCIELCPQLHFTDHTVWNCFSSLSKRQTKGYRDELVCKVICITECRKFPHMYLGCQFIPLVCLANINTHVHILA